MDDLLTDYYEERNKLVEKESKWASVQKFYNSDDDDKTQKKKEALLTKFVDDCQKQARRLYLDTLFIYLFIFNLAMFCRSTCVTF